MIDTKAIRSKILDLAMRGKLTEQLPEDGTAEELYRQIQAEKQSLIKAVKIKKEKPLPEIASAEEPYTIPTVWKWVRMGSVAEISGGTTPSSAETSASGLIPYFKVADMNIAGNETYMNVVSTYVTDSYSGKIFPAGTIIFPKNGGAALTNKRRILTLDSAIDLNTGGCTPVIPSMTGWIRLYLDTVDFGRINTGSNIPTVNATALKMRLFPLPPLPEQHRIVARIEQAFSTLDTIDALQAKYADNLTVLKSKLIDAAIQGKLTEQLPEDGTAEELYRQIQAEKQALVKAGKIKKEKPLSTSPEYLDYPFTIPENWKFVRFGDLMINRDSERIPVSVEERRKRKKVFDYYGASGVIDKIDDYLFDKELLLIGEDGANLLARSSPIAFIASGQYWVNNHAHVLDVCGGLSLKYFCHYINGISLDKFVTGTAQPKLNQENMNAIWIALPPLAEQQRIVAKLDEVLEMIGQTPPRALREKNASVPQGCWHEKGNAGFLSAGRSI